MAIMILFLLVTLVLLGNGGILHIAYFMVDQPFRQLKIETVKINQSLNNKSIRHSLKLALNGPRTILTYFTELLVRICILTALGSCLCIGF